jgi:internalin A
MNDYEQAVFISYAWGDEHEEIVNQIDQALHRRGIKIIRDKRNLGYKGSIHEFMERIGRGNCVIIVISDKYLRSKNCMFELVEIANNKQFSDRIFPIILPDAKIYDAVERLDYVEFWEQEKAKLNERIRKLSDLSNLQGVREELDNYDRFRDQISGLTSILKDMNTLTPDLHQDSDFSELYTAIEKRMQEKAETQAGETSPKPETDSPEGTRPTTVSASNNSIGIGSFQVGGNVNGNIVIGNNNKVNKK